MITIKSTPLKNYTQQVDKAVVIFGSPTCSACKKVINVVVPLLEQVYTDIEFMFLDADKFVGCGDYYNIEYYPTLVYFEKGVEKGRIQSTYIKEIEKILNKNL
jgi:thiol-disulfide isomerase/thioredoxin